MLVKQSLKWWYLDTAPNAHVIEVVHVHWQSQTTRLHVSIVHGVTLDSVSRIDDVGTVAMVAHAEGEQVMLQLQIQVHDAHWRCVLYTGI